MRTLKPLIVAVVLCLAVSPAVFPQSDCPAPGSLTFGTTLTGTQFGGSGAANGFGSGFITLDPLTGQATITMNVGGIGSSITSAGLFQNGTLFIPFTDANTTFTNGVLTRTITLTPAQMNAVLANPTAFSFGVTTAEFAAGALSGALIPLQTFGGTLSGRAVVGSPGAPAGDGAFTAQLIPNPSGGNWLLIYSLTPSGIGDTISGVELRAGGAGLTGPLFASVGPATMSNGQITGSIALPADQAIAIMTNPRNFYLNVATSQFPQGAVRGQFSANQNEVFIPVAGAVLGAAGSRWATDVNIFNESYAQAATVTIQYLPSNQPNTSNSGGFAAANVATVTVAPRNVSAQTKILSSLFNIQNGLGALRLVSDQPIAATARIYNDQSAEGRGTLGEVTDAMSRCRAVSRGVLVGVSGSAAGDLPFRTNIGFFNPTGSEVRINLELRSEVGSAGKNSITLPAFGMMQVPSLGSGGLFSHFPSAVFSGAVAYQASAPIFAYASINDNASGDTSIVFAQPDLTSPAIEQTEIGGIILATNQSEIAVANVGVTRATAAAVRTFAQQMSSEHTTAYSDAMALFRANGITPIPLGATIDAIQKAGRDAVTTLTGTAMGASFDKAFMQQEVLMHQQLIALLDTTVIPSAGNPSLLQFVQNERTIAATHLALAQQILSTLP